MRLAVVIVHYHAGPLLAQAVAALRADLAASGLTAELIVVDNGSTAEERAALGALPVRTIDAGGNTGYAGGLNLGIAAAAPADAYVLMNPDVEVQPGCLAALVTALGSGAGAAGPRFFWDRTCRLLLPPTEDRRRSSEIVTRLAARGGRWERWARARWRRHARRHWLADGPLPTRALSGALLAVRREAWDAVGHFDEGFRLYFEEDDWLRRLAQRGLSSLYVPAARAVHLYAQSASREPAALGWFRDSAERFQRRHYGRWFPRLLACLDARAAAPPASTMDRPVLALSAGTRRDRTGEPPRDLWVEVSPSPVGFPAAAERLLAPRGEWRLPEGLLDHMAPGRYLLRVVGASGEELGCAGYERLGVP